jgi:TolB-like protein
MKTVIKTLLLISLCTTALFANSNEETAKETTKATVAVMNFKGRGVSSDEALVVTDRFSLELGKVGVYNVVDRNNIQAIIMEQELGTSGYIEESEAISIGKILAAKYIIFGSVSTFGSMFTVSSKMINVETGAIEKSSMNDCEGDISQLLKSAVKECAYGIAGVEVPKGDAKKEKKEKRRKSRS